VLAAGTRRTQDNRGAQCFRDEIRADGTGAVHRTCPEQGAGEALAVAEITGLARYQLSNLPPVDLVRIAHLDAGIPCIDASRTPTVRRCSSSDTSASGSTIM